jgi:hypothetical protein
MRKKHNMCVFKEDDLVMVLLQLAETGEHVPTLAFVKKVTVTPVSPSVFQDQSLAAVLSEYWSLVNVQALSMFPRYK